MKRIVRECENYDCAKPASFVGVLNIGGTEEIMFVCADCRRSCSEAIGISIMNYAVVHPE